MKKTLFILLMIVGTASLTFAQKGNQFTFSKIETADDFPMKGKTITVEGQLIASESGNMITDYEIHYFVQQRPNKGDVMLTKVMMQAPMMGKSKKKELIKLSTFYISKELGKKLTFETTDKTGFYNISAPGFGIPYESISTDEAEKKRGGFEEDSYGFGSVGLGKFKSVTDFENFKKMLQQ